MVSPEKAKTGGSSFLPAIKPKGGDLEKPKKTGVMAFNETTQKITDIFKRVDEQNPDSLPSQGNDIAKERDKKSGNMRSDEEFES